MQQNRELINKVCDLHYQLSLLKIELESKKMILENISSTKPEVTSSSLLDGIVA